jgi:hypothetical protein
MQGLGDALGTIDEEPQPCPLCGGPVIVQKTVPRSGRTLEHGDFNTRESVYVCAAGCRWPAGPLVSQKAACLAQRLPFKCATGYDVMVFVGQQRFVHHRQREEIRKTLFDKHAVQVSTGEVSVLERRFVTYLQRLHVARRDAIAQAFANDGGWPLHVDATGEDGRGTLLIAYAGWRRWVLGAWKIPTEHADAILPCLRHVVACFGPPVAVMRDLGRAMTCAVNALVEELERDITVLACHQHFLADVGNDLLKARHSELRELFRRFSVLPQLRKLARDLGRQVGENIDRARAGLATWLQDTAQDYALPKGDDGLAVVRGIAQWVLDYAADGNDLGLPFDRPYLDLYDRCTEARRAIDAFLRPPPAERRVHRALLRLRNTLDPVLCDVPFSQVARILRSRAALLDELRDALRLVPKSTGRNELTPADPASSQRALDELRDVKQAVESFVDSLRERRPQRGPAQDMRQGIDLILRHTDVHGPTLWGHSVELPAEVGGGSRLVERTNYLLENLNHDIKHGERRRSGRTKLTQDLENLPAGAVLTFNLPDPDYVALLCGSLDQLAPTFAALDTDERVRQLMGTPTNTAPPLFTSPTTVATASLPREDRPFVRAESMGRRLKAAANSKAPKTGRRRRSPT